MCPHIHSVKHVLGMDIALHRELDSIEQLTAVHHQRLKISNDIAVSVETLALILKVVLHQAITGDD